MRGKLITIDGIDGSGKTTILNRLQEKYKNCELVTMSGVGKKNFMNEIRLLSKKLNKDIENFFSPLFINIIWVMEFYTTGCYIEKLLSGGTHVVVDRYILSAKTYARATTQENMEIYNKIYELLPKPDLSFFIDVNPEIAIDRISKRKKEIVKYENKLDLTNIKQVYEQLINEENISIIKVNGEKMATEVFDIIDKYLSSLIK